MKYPWFKLLAAWTAGTGLALAQTPLPPATGAPEAVHTNVISAAMPLGPEEPAIAKPAPAHPTVPPAEGKDFAVVLDETPPSGAVNTPTTTAQPAPVQPAPSPVLAQPTSSGPLTGLPAGGPATAATATDPRLDLSSSPPDKAARPGLWGRIDALLGRFKSR